MTAVDLLPIPSPGSDLNWRAAWENFKKIRNHFQSVNVRDFGAKGDRVTDDLPAIERAIRFAVSRGIRRVYFPDGDYGISATINLKTLLNISDALVAQGYFTLEGDNPNTCRLIPMADITGAMISCVNAGTGNAANARQLYFKNIGFYSDDTLNKSAEYAVYFKWCAEVYFHNCVFKNCATKRLVYYDTTFVCTFKDCIFMANEGSQGDAGTDEPDAVSNAFTAPPVALNDRLTGLYFANTCTTTILDTCRVNRCRVGVNFNNGDMMVLVNNAIESCPDYGLYLSGSTANINVTGNYWEGNVGNIYIGARADSPIIQGNFLHGGDYGIKIVSATLRGAVIDGNYFFSSVDGIILDAPTIDGMSIRRNYFDVDTSELVYPYDTLNTYGTNGHKLDWADNFSTTNGKLFERSGKNYNLLDWQDFSLELAPTITPSDKKFRIANAYDVTHPNQNGFFYKEVVGISSIINQDLRGSWMTVFLPLKYTSVFDVSQTVTASNSGGDLLLTFATDMPDTAVVRFTTTAALPTGLSINTNYWLKRQSATTAKVGVSYDDVDGVGPDVYIAYTTAGTGTHTMAFKDPGGKIRISDGVSDKEFLIGGLALDTWAVRRAYFKLDAAATSITVRLYPHGANLAVENLVILKGIHSEYAVAPDYFHKLYIRPNEQGAKTPLRMYQEPDSNVVIAAIDNPGSPAYGSFKAYDSTGALAAEMSGGLGIRITAEGLGYNIKEGGSNPMAGRATLVAGVVTVTTNKVTANSHIWLQRQTDGGTVGASYSITRVAATSFTITAKDGAGANQTADTSTLAWEIREPT